jgi:DMSO/TMAO reductase YedYZ molybdopterin-dependent catalytic subunit
VLPHETVTTDLHCVTKGSNLDTIWAGVSVDTLLKDALARGVEVAPSVLAMSDGGYPTSLLRANVIGGKAWVAVTYAGAPLAPEHGGRPGASSRAAPLLQYLSLARAP